MSDDLRACAARIETLLKELETVGGPLAWTRVQALVTELVELYGAALARVLDHAGACATDRAELHRRLAEDDLVSNLLSLHALHPMSLEQRIEGALERARSQLVTGASLELEGVVDGVASVRVRGAQSGSSALLTSLVSRAIEAEVPEIQSVRIEGAPPPAPPPENIVRVERLVQKARP